MVRVVSVDLNLNKRIDIALTKIYGIGRKNVVGILTASGIPASKRTKDLTEEEISRLQKNVENYKVEGDLKQEVQGNIKRLKEIGSYRGTRHSRNLPVRGQRTRSNARTKRGKRMTIGAIKKEMAQRMGLITKEDTATATK